MHRDQALELNCLVHGRRKFVEIGDYFPSECARVIDAIAEIYRHEAYCKEQRLTPAGRLAYHQAHSGPVMEELQARMGQQITERREEPNSRLGGPSTTCWGARNR